MFKFYGIAFLFTVITVLGTGYFKIAGDGLGMIGFFGAGVVFGVYMRGYKRGG